MRSFGPFVKAMIHHELYERWLKARVEIDQR
jgi:hypothetical protein